jgi:GNAT superfamily N-acetyltransferase
MQKVTIGDSTYQLVTNFKTDTKIRQSFNQLAQSVFHFSFEDWYQRGLWGDSYIPYSLMWNGEIVSNVSITRMNLKLDGQQKTGLQIGTVMTNEDFRNRGLNKYLLQHILREWENKVDFIYLFANDSVLDFYPKFNFHSVDQYEVSKPFQSKGIKLKYRRLDVNVEKDYQLLAQSISESSPHAAIADLANVSLVMFYCLWFMQGEVYYFEELDAVILATIEEQTLIVKDVFARNMIPLDDMVDSLSGEIIDQVKLGFTPVDTKGYTETKLATGTDTLFVYGDKADEFREKKWMFPVMSHA